MYSYYPKKTFFNLAVNESNLDPKARKMSITFYFFIVAHQGLKHNIIVGPSYSIIQIYRCQDDSEESQTWKTPYY